MAVSNLEKLDDETAKQKKMKLFPAGTVIFAKSGMSCVTGNIYILPEPCYVVSHLACIITNKKLAEYLRYYFEFDKPCKLIENASFPSIRLGKISNMAIPLPADAEMLRQTAVLKYVDQLKRQYGLQLHTLDSLIKSRFVEMFNEVKQTSILEELIDPETRISYGIVQPGPEGTGDMGVLRPVDIADGRLCLDTVKMIDRAIGNSYRRTELMGDEILTIVRGATGQTVRSKVDCAGMNVTRGIAVIRHEPSLIDPDYLVGYMNSDNGKRYIADHTQGATLQQINIADLRVMPIPVPPLALQQEFAAFVSQVDKLRFATQQQIDKLETLKKSLMQEYFG